VRCEFESLVGKDQYDLGENWIRLYIIDEVFMLYQAYVSFQNGSCEINYTRVNWCNYNTIE
jgi:hypothetical protein